MHASVLCRGESRTPPPLAYDQIVEVLCSKYAARNARAAQSDGHTRPGGCRMDEAPQVSRPQVTVDRPRYRAECHRCRTTAEITLQILQRDVRDGLTDLVATACLGCGSPVVAKRNNPY